MGKLSLIGAAERGRLDVVEQFVAAGADVNAVNSRCHNALRGAVAGGHTSVARFLLHRGANVDAESQDGMTALYLAARNQDLEMVSLLLSSGADPNAGLSPLIGVAENGGLEIAQILIRSGADVNGRSGGKIALYFAIDAGHLEVARLLLSTGADANLAVKWGWTPLYAAVGRCASAAVELLLSYGADARRQYKYRYEPKEFLRQVDETALHLAVTKSDEAIAKLLVTAGADPAARNMAGATPLDLAWKSRCAPIVRMLLPGVPTSAHKQIQMLTDAVADDQVDLVRIFLSTATSSLLSGVEGRALLAAAFGKVNEAIIDLLLANGADIDSPDSDGLTLLHEAVDIGPTRVKRLLKRRANAEAVDNEGMTPLIRAASVRLSTTQVLLENGANVDAADHNGWTALHWAASGVADEVRNVSFNVAVQIGREEREGDDYEDAERIDVSESGSADSVSADIVELLIRHGANVNQESHDGTTPMALARNDAPAAVLRKHGAVE